MRDSAVCGGMARPWLTALPAAQRRAVWSADYSWTLGVNGICYFKNRFGNVEEPYFHLEALYPDDLNGWPCGTGVGKQQRSRFAHSVSPSPTTLSLDTRHECYEEHICCPF